ncbi:MAG: diaminopimelate decarboxylase [Candidatus Peregrinibacteria bacterium]
MTPKLLPFPQEQLEEIAQTYGTPVFVTSEKILRERARQMKSAFPMKKKILYAIKANSNPHIVKILQDEGIDGIDTVSIFEVQLALDIGFSAENIVFTGANPSDEELRFVHEKGVLVNAGSLSELERFGKMFPGGNIAVRINPGVGAGLFAGNVTGGEKSKFGIPALQFEEAKEILKKYDLQLVGIHAHVGSGFYSPEEFVQSAELVLSEAKNFQDLEFVDFGGGFGIPYTEEKEHLDLQEFGRQIAEKLQQFSQENGREIEMRIEPGRFLPCESTLLLASVTTIKNTPTRTFVGLNTGMHHLIRPAMYGAYHHILNVSHPEAEKITADIVGNVCESSDFFARDREIATPQENDLLAILDAGAYGTAMSSNYNLQPLAAEVLVRENGEIQLIKKRQTYEQMVENFGSF